MRVAIIACVMSFALPLSAQPAPTAEAVPPAATVTAPAPASAPTTPVPTAAPPQAPTVPGSAPDVPVPAAVAEAAPSTHMLALADAVKAARAHQPTLRQARATTAAARARVDQAGAPLYPQVNVTAQYQRATGNFVSRPGTVPNNLGGTPPPADFDTFDFLNFGLTANQLIWDFGQTTGRKHAAQATVEAQEENETTTLLTIDQNVRVAFFNARAAKELLAVAQETLANYERHKAQIQGFVNAGTRAEIDLAQARTDSANARVSLINAENSYASAKAALNQAMGVESSTDYDVADDGIPEVSGEGGSLDALVSQALKVRPEFAALQKQIRSQELTRETFVAARLPTLGVSVGATEAGGFDRGLVWNFNAGANVTWPIYQGGVTVAQAAEVDANIAGLHAQEDVLRQQVRVDVEQAQLSVRAAKAALEASEEAVTAARERRRLAEGRYAIGVGNGLELGDAELAQTTSLSQRVQAEYSLSSARARLLRALGVP